VLFKKGRERKKEKEEREQPLINGPFLIPLLTSMRAQPSEKRGKEKKKGEGRRGGGGQRAGKLGKKFHPLFLTRNSKATAWEEREKKERKEGKAFNIILT